MHSKNIKFANEFCFTAIFENAWNQVKIGINDYQILQDDLFIKNTEGEFVRVVIAKEERLVLQQLQLSYGRGLYRPYHKKGH